MPKIKSYLKELTIITIGVLIALFVGNIKENSQSKKYYNTSIETIKNEVKSNYIGLKGVVEKQTNLVDTIRKYSTDQITISNLILEKGKGLQIATLDNSGLDFYKKNHINSIDFEIMSSLIKMESLSKLIDTKMDKLINYIYPNLFSDSEESKRLTILYLNNLLNSEIQLMQQYENFIDRYIEKEKNDK